MRLVVMFDLPVLTQENRRNYAKFRRFLLKNGFLMMQESVYCRMMPTPSVELSVINKVKANKPPEGIVQILSITEKQFESIQYIVGESNSIVLDSDERLVII